MRPTEKGRLLQPRSGRRYVALDGLRGAGAFVVVVYHVLLVVPAISAMYSIGKVPPTDPQAFSIPWWLQRTPLRVLWGGHEAVLIFFVLSGMVLTLPLVRGASSTSWRAYYVRRLTRLYVPVWGALILALLLALVVRRNPDVGSTWLRSHVPPTRSALWHDFSLVLGTSNLDSPLWSLRWEIWFSLLLPIMFGILRGMRVGRWWRIAVPLLGAVAAVANVPSVKSALPGSFLTGGLLQYMPIFAIGMIICMALDDIVASFDRAWRGIGATTRRSVFVVLAVLMLIGPGCVSNRAPAVVAAVLDLGSALGVVAIVLLALESAMFARFLSTPVMQWAGSRSFSIYLVHEPIIVAAAIVIQVDRPLPWLFVAPAVVAAALGIAEMFYRAVERPAHGLSRSLGLRVERRTDAPARS